MTFKRSTTAKVLGIKKLTKKDSDKLSRACKWFIWLLVFGFFFGVAVLWYMSRGLPSFEQLENFTPELATKVYSADGKLVSEFFTQRRFYTPLSDIPQRVKNAVLAIEDHQFYEHWGVSPSRFFLVTMKFILSGGSTEGGGASTLTQQLARRLYLTPEQTVTRKIKEILTAIQIERAYTKDEILEMYMNQMQFSYATYGVESAARYLFDKSIQDVDLAEAALLAGAAQRPAIYNPYENYDRTKSRRNFVLSRMVEEGFITRAVYDSCAAAEIVLKEHSEETPIDDPSYFTEHVRRLLYEKYGYDIYETGLRIYTTLDTRLQTAANRAIRNHLPKLQERVNNSFRRRRNFAYICPPSLLKRKTLEQVMQDKALVDSLIAEKCRVQVAFVALDPHNGHILAMVGGRNYEESEFNRATQAIRQPGSAFKPILYTTAIDNGFMPFYTKLNQPVTVEDMDGQGTRWTPQNYDHSVGGETPLREALRRSLNLVSVRLIKDDVPPQRVIEYARNLGISTPLEPVDALALGAIGVKPIELVSAFSVFANKGVWVKPVAILKIEDKYGNVIETATTESRGVLREETAFIMASMLQTVASAGTGAASRSVYKFYHPAGGKTGTTNEYTDAWYITFTPEIVAGVWVGLDDPKMSLGERQSGAVAALPITAPFMKEAVDTLHIPATSFERPPGIVDVSVCMETQKLATEYCPNVIRDICDVRYLPKERCDLHTGEKSKQPAAQKRRIRY
ncbi:PBP1A family penicillin-binding protein [candidate division KSB1 bacterium]|nr:PBP1A family penicillin-binding protein [candidate division KSB1 bacterium]RQW10790.1 MAG: PBP1A family penicillin-binding protein [candidate division KSB1 bacterium]